MKFRGVATLQGVDIVIFLLTFEWPLQQRSTTALPVIKLCPSGAQTCVLPLFCDRDLQINPMTLKLEGGQDILKMYPHNESEAASLRHSKLKSLD